MLINKTTMLIILLIIGSVLGLRPVLGQILFPDEYEKLDFHPTTLSPAAKNFTKYKEEIDHLKSINDFVNFFNMSLPADPYAAPIATRVRSGLPVYESAGIHELIKQLIAQIEGPKRDTPYVHSLEQANCEPELTTVTLDFKREKGVTYFPTCVRVQRCGGCCYLADHSCQPSEIEIMPVKVIRVQQQVTRARRRNVRNAEADFMVVPVEQHNTCDCQCKLQAKDCIAEIHNYNSHQCACVCKNKEAELKCVASNKHFWNNSKCKCLCRNELACSTGQEFDHETCSCVSVSINIV